MGFLEKLKNTFFEEEYVEVEEEIVEKPIAKKVEAKPKKEEKQVEEFSLEKEVLDDLVTEIPNYSDRELLKKDVSIQYFEDDDFVEEVNQPKFEEKKKLYGEDPVDLYEHLAVEKNTSYSPYTNSGTKATFKPTPIISPIYGVLDKNYRKEEVVDKKDKPSSYVSRRNADLDFVRNKAFGNYEDEQILDSLSNKVKAKEKISDDYENDITADSLLADMTEVDDFPEVNKVTIADAEEYFEDLGLEYNVDYKDSRYEKATGRRSIKEAIFEEQEEKSDIEEDNLFDLIDSMYEEKE